MEHNTTKNTSLNQITKLEKFDGSFFRRWKTTIYFFLSALKLSHVLNEEKPTKKENEIVAEIRTRNKWNEDDFMCKGHILNALSNSLYDVYEINFAEKTTKDLCEDLESKYKTEDAEHKKFLVSKLFDFNMLDSKSIMSQVNQLQYIRNQIISKYHTLDKSF
ncbi:UBN2_2 domain-containing protein [Cephalotus follicularis]|uniref:UBN2_2 domain-containing protein n=1 Tax=Cephalotus follicularis TaxID=3775 RepID=A0A1Q3CPS1_CEPFO|nr:UBN2_2 domain-containing protein [Cephalotus follicularis]